MDFIEVKTASNCTDLAFDQDVSQALKRMSDSCDCEAMVLVKAAKILRKHILNMKFDFTESEVSKGIKLSGWHGLNMSITVTKRR